jgi:hypothetical protein
VNKNGCAWCEDQRNTLYLVGFRATRASERALAYAAGQAMRHGAELLVVVADLDPALWPTQERARRLEVAALRARVGPHLGERACHGGSASPRSGPPWLCGKGRAITVPT